MRKMKLVMLSLAFTAFASFTAFAADQGWVKENDTWYYLDKDGDTVENAWKTNADGTLYFYLNEDGEMATSSLIEDGEYLYYVNADGVQSRNQWRLLETEDADEARWYYFDAKGRAVENTKKVIDGKTYYFDEEGQMLYGWAFVGTASNATMVDTFADGNIYLGDNTTGWRWDNCWFKETDLEGTSYENVENVNHLWFYFTSNGKKETDFKERIDGIDYLFDADGVMLEEVFVDDAEDNTYFASKSGAIYKDRWFWVEDEEAEDGNWYYAQKNGKLIKNEIKKIGGKNFLFDADGKMITGFVASGSDASMFEKDLLDVKSNEFTNADYSYFVEYGNRVEDTTIELELEDGFFVFGFDKNGKALNGEVEKRIYVNGILQRAVDAKYAILENGKIVNASGKIMTGDKYTIDDVVYEKQANGTYAEKAN